MDVRVTKRDKNLLSGLGCFCVAVFFSVYAIMPLHAANKKLDRQAQDNQEQIADMEGKAEKLPMLREWNLARQAMLRETQEKLYPMLKSQEIDRLLTEKVMSHGLSARRLQITMPDGPANVVRYEEKGGDGSNPEYADGVWIAMAVLDVSGPAESMDALIDELAMETPGVRIAGLFWDRRENEYLQPGAEAQEHILRIQLEILMSRKD